MSGVVLTDPKTFRRAEFGSAPFDHFERPEFPTCFACNSRAMLVRPLVVTDRYTLLEATTRLSNGAFVVMPSTWLVYPRVHVTTFRSMPSYWTICVQDAVRQLGLEEPFGITDNYGPEAGQTVPHAHTWIMKRGVGEDGLLTQNTGFATTLMRVKQHRIVLPE